MSFTWWACFSGLIVQLYIYICYHVAFHPVQTFNTGHIVSFRWLINELVIMYKVSIRYLQIQNERKPFKMEYFKLKLDPTSIKQHRSSINVRSLLPSTNSLTKEILSQRANNDSFRVKMTNTWTCSPTPQILYLLANYLYFSAKRSKTRHIDMWTVDFFVWNRVGEANVDSGWPGWFQNTTAGGWKEYLEEMKIKYDITENTNEDEANDTSPKEKILKAFKTRIEKVGENKNKINS